MIAFQKYAEIFSAYAQDQLIDQAPQNLYQPIDYILSLGGKKIRPLLALLGRNLYQESLEDALPIAYAVELFHNVSLMHDDIMDDAHLRRGKPAVHEKFGVNAAILSGDAMFAHSFAYINRGFKNNRLTEALQLFCNTSIQVCEGQQLDVDFETRDLVTQDEYIQMISYKTAVLLSCSIALGAMTGGASDQDTKSLYDYALNLGIAFQIHDDYLDTYGQSELVGKKVGGDILQNKKTILWIRALDQGFKERIQEALAIKDDSTKINKFLEIYKDAEADQFALSLKMEYFNKALKNIDTLEISDLKKEWLYQFAQNLMDRIY